MELAAIFAEHWEAYASAHRHCLAAPHHRAARAVMACRTPVMGGRVYACECGRERYAYHSCNHRSCTKCGALAQKEWAAAQEAKLLPVPYFMLTFTVPEELRQMAYAGQEWFYDAMFRAASATLMDFAHDKRHLGGTPGFTAVLHTWTRQMAYHPHLHVIMPGVALSADGLRIKRAKLNKYLFNVDALAAAFRNRLRRLIEAHDAREGTKLLRNLPPHLWHMAWGVHAKAVGNGRRALRYLARYASKSALSERRLLGYTNDGRIRLNCQRSDNGKWEVILLTPDEFLRRWSLHVLPKGLVRLRHYGFHCTPAKAKLQRVRDILQTPAPVKPAPIAPPKPKCPCCGKDMAVAREIPRPSFALRLLMQTIARQSRAPQVIIQRPSRPAPTPIDSG